MSSTESAAPLLSLAGIVKRFGPVEALTGIHLEVNAGEIVALVGDNAAGKSTVAKIVAGVLQPDGGLIEMAGEVVSIPSPSAAQRLGGRAVDDARDRRADVEAGDLVAERRPLRAQLDLAQ